MPNPNRPQQRQGHRTSGYGSDRGGQRFQGGGRRDERQGPSATLRDLLPGINLREPGPDLFDKTAEKTAHEVAEGRREVNKSAQIRKFFDELCMWETRVSRSPDKFGEYLPFIRMMNAKVAYARGRNLVDENFRAFFQHCVQQIADDKTLRHAKLFFEAFLGFYKVEKRD